MTYAEASIQRNGICVHIVDNCSPDSPRYDDCPNPKPGPFLIRLAETMADQRTSDLPKGHRFRVVVTRYKNLTGHTKNLVTIHCDRCEAKVETGPLKLNAYRLDYHVATTWHVFKSADFGRSCREYRRLKEVKAVMNQ